MSLVELMISTISGRLLEIRMKRIIASARKKHIEMINRRTNHRRWSTTNLPANPKSPRTPRDSRSHNNDLTGTRTGTVCGDGEGSKLDSRMTTPRFRSSQRLSTGIMIDWLDSEQEVDPGIPPTQLSSEPSTPRPPQIEVDHDSKSQSMFQVSRRQSTSSPSSKTLLAGAIFHPSKSRLRSPASISISKPLSLSKLSSLTQIKGLISHQNPSNLKRALSMKSALSQDNESRNMDLLTEAGTESISRIYPFWSKSQFSSPRSLKVRDSMEGFDCRSSSLAKTKRKVVLDATKQGESKLNLSLMKVINMGPELAEVELYETLPGNMTKRRKNSRKHCPTVTGIPVEMETKRRLDATKKMSIFRVKRDRGTFMDSWLRAQFDHRILIVVGALYGTIIGLEWYLVDSQFLTF
eukprot:1345021-Amorphochlora_amoeboformis.AAC.1